MFLILFAALFLSSMTYCLYTEKVWMAIFSATVATIVAQLVFGVPIVEWIYQNPGMSAAVFLGYFVLGGGYSVMRWRFRMGRIAAQVRDKGSDVDDSGVRTINAYGRNLVYKMKVANQKALLTSWIAFWPFDSLILVFEEPVQRMYEWLYNRYVSISKNALDRHGISDVKLD